MSLLLGSTAHQAQNVLLIGVNICKGSRTTPLFGSTSSSVEDILFRSMLTLSFQRMPPRASYWKYFTRVGNTATCNLGGCPKPAVSCGKEQTPGEKKVKTGEFQVL